MITPPVAPPAPASGAHAPPRPSDDAAALRRTAQQLEAAFLAEMLKAAGDGTPRASFGGGAGEDQFASFLVELRAEAMVARGGIGLSEAIFNALKGRGHAG